MEHTARFLQKSVVYHPLMNTILPDRQFNWKSVIFSSKDEIDKLAATSEKNKVHRVVPISMDLVSKLGVRVLHNRQLCLGGRELQGIYLPKNQKLQLSLIKRFLVWYSPCIGVKQKRYTINKYCFNRREHEFLRMYLKSLGYHHYLWKPLLPGHFYKPI